MTNGWDYVPPKGYKPADPEKAKLVIKLGCMITDRMTAKLSHKMTYDDPEYWMLDEVLTKDEVKFMLSFEKTRVSYDIPALAKRNGMTEEQTQKMVDHLLWIGALESNRETPDKHMQYDVPIFVPGIAEFMMMQDKLVEEHPKIATFFNLMTQMPLENVTPMIPLGGSGVGMHVIPVEKAIENTSEAVSVEKLSHWLSKYDKYSIGVCTCRRQQAMRHEGSGDVEGEFCIGVGDMAEYCVNRGTGRYISYDEVMEVLERSERHGFVHQITNIDGENKIVGICNCAPGVCNALRTSQLYNTPNLSRSAYRAHVDHDKCVACGKCVEVCPVGAAKLGQKLCTKNGPIEYPVTELPDAKHWSADKWNIHYREDAKINCYPTGTSPCKTACPAHIAVQGYVKMAGEGKYREALELIKQDNPFPAVCGAICNRRCEDECTRGTIDQPVAIDEIKKFISAKELEEKYRFIPVCEKEDGGMWGPDYRMAIIGGGPAGLSCAYYLRTRGYDVTVFEKESRMGGMMTNGIPNFRLEKDIVDAEISILQDMGIEFKTGVEVGRDVTIQQLRDQGYKAFYIAIGLQGGRTAGVPGEFADGIVSGIDFLKDVNQDKTQPLAGDVVVIGGGNVAVDVARTAERLTDGKVTMICLEGTNEMPAADDEVAEAKDEGIEVMNGWGPKEFLSENGHVTGVIFKRCTQVKNADGRFDPKYNENDTITVKCDNVLEAIGQSAQWGDLLKDTKCTLRRGGTIEVDPLTFQTSEPDIFAGGDIQHGARFAIDAIAEGKKACESMHRFVHKGQSLTIGRDRREFNALDKDNIIVEGYDNAKRQVPGHREMANGKKSFEDLRLPLTEEQVKKEAGRCLSCGATTVDINRCIGCGLCTTRCEFDAIHLTRDLPDASNMCRAEDKMKYVLPYEAKRAAKILFRKG
ncbi:MAG: FAD-dependent oxidoreductase [Lachnospiraceae bacterium]